MNRSLAAMARAATIGIAAAFAALLPASATSIANDTAPAAPLTRAAACRALADSRTLAASLVGTMYGDVPSFDRVQISSTLIHEWAASDLGASDAELKRLLTVMGRRADFLLQQRQTVLQDGERLHLIQRGSAALLEQTLTLGSMLLQNGATQAETGAASLTPMLSQRIALSAQGVIAWDGIRPESVFLLGKDLKTLREILDGLRKGDASLRLHAQRAPAVRKAIDEAIATEETLVAASSALLDSLKDLVAAKDTQVRLQADADQLGHGLAMACAGSDASAPGPWTAPGRAVSADR